MQTKISDPIREIKSMVAKVVSNQLVQPNYYDMELLAPEIAATAKPGQFLMIKPNQLYLPLLGRPMGIYDWDTDKGTINILYGVHGKGTNILATVKPGIDLSIVAPLGRSFKFYQTDKKVIVLAGGVGVAPLFPVIKELQKNQVRTEILLGAPTAERVLSMEKLGQLGLSGMNLTIFTDDGSMGTKGYSTETLSAMLATGEYQRVYCCGSMAMMEAVAGIAEGFAVPCQVSLEERMGCGIGICMGCVCHHKDENGQRNLARVCYEGPVFDSKEVIWHG